MDFMLIFLNQRDTKFDESVYREMGASPASSPPRAGSRAARRCSTRNKGARIQASRSEAGVTDGPFTETKEVIAGFFLIEAKDLKEAVEIAGAPPREERLRRGAPADPARLTRRRRIAVPRFLLLLAPEPPSGAWSAAELGARTARFVAWVEALRASGALRDVARLDSRAGRLRGERGCTPNAELVVDAPLRHYLVLEARDWDEALTLAARCPAAEPGSVEVYRVEGDARLGAPRPRRERRDLARLAGGDLPRGVRPPGRHADPPARRLRPRRGAGAGGAGRRAGTLAADGDPGESGRLADGDGAQPRARPPAAREAGARQAAADRDRVERAPSPEPEHAGEGPLADDRLRLIYTCCHPALPPESRSALTLRLVGGLSTREIASAFLISEATAAQRIVRAKRAIRERRLPYRVPEPSELPERLASVLEVIYLIFNEGYAAREGEVLVRAGLCDEALRLARLLEEHAPEQGEVQGLLALLELQAARQATRADARGELVLLEDQDRSRWDRVRIERARRRVERAFAGGDPGACALQAAIALCHALAPSFADTDWRRIAALYAVLAEQTGSPVVELNRAVAVAMAEGPEAGLALLEAQGADARLADYALLHATRGDLLRRLGRHADALPHFDRALALTENAAERRHLERRIRECRR